MTSIFHEVTPLLQSFIVCLEDFDIGKKLGSGGFGEVYYGVHEPSGYRCAIKRLFFKELKGDDLLLFKREIEVLIRCTNPFCLPIVGWTAYYPYSIITQYIPNGSLYQKLYKSKQNNKLTPTEKSIIMYGIAVGMEHIHNLGIIHRDLKSMNILLDDRNFPMICDFGLSRVLPEEHELMTLEIGTTNWMAPELFEKSEYTEKIDVYAFSMIIVEMLTESMPFIKYKDAEIAKMVLAGKRPKLPDDTPRKIKHLVTRCWSQNPSERPTFSDIVKELKHGDVVFQNTNYSIFMDELSFATKKLALSNSSETPRPPLFSESAIKRAATESSQKLRPRFDRLQQFTMPDYIENFSACAHSLTLQNAQIFFSGVANAFKDQSAKDFIPKILDTLEHLFAKKKTIIGAFSESGILEKMPVFPHDHSMRCLNIIKLIVEKEKDSLTPNMLSYIRKFIPNTPADVIQILSIPLSKFSSKKSSWDVIDFAIDCWRLFINSYAEEYLNFMMKVISENPQLEKYRAKYFRSILLEVLNMSNSYTASAYKICLLKSDDGFVIPSQVLAKHISTGDFIDLAVSYIAKVPTVEPSVGLLSALLKHCGNHEGSYQAVLQLCSLHRTACVNVIHLRKEWLNHSSVSNQKKAKILESSFAFNKVKDAAWKTAEVRGFVDELRNSHKKEDKKLYSEIMHV